MIDSLAAQLDADAFPRDVRLGLAVQACVLHSAHSPVNHTIEFHHIVPVAWQQTFTTPTSEPDPGQDPDGRGHLWDGRGAWCCPTGHRNVHYWIVRLMKAHAGGVTAVLPRGETTDTAALALARFVEVGGSLDALIAAHQWGQV